MGYTDTCLHDSMAIMINEDGSRGMLSNFEIIAANFLLGNLVVERKSTKGHNDNHYSIANTTTSK